ncbi:hypothetical protein IFT59_07565 [Rhizobium sp. CFBP 8752]|uniref:DUF6538 domain-containing protein n=1 Tax=Rhizobium sp. CFBP 8752 TaxID=2775301 RepID=UPI00177D6421|nr:DUF6538 domain-containing protein [Rhizobium sp. CFBP 8752]MBD8663109.1 hypothetical protein [Rhizobium sp. CFBP 8752]
MDPNYIVERASGYHFRIAVPPNLRAKLGKREVWRSLKTKDRKTARFAVAPLYEKWSHIFATGIIPDEIEIVPETITDNAKRSGLTYRSDEDYLYAPIEKSIEAIFELKSATSGTGRRNKLETATHGGVVAAPGMTMTQALERYKELSPDKFMAYSDERDRYKRWRPFVQAAQAFTDVMGKVDVLKLKPKDCFIFKNALVEQVRAGKLKVETARKKIMWLRLIHTKVLECDAPELLPCPWDRITIDSNGAEKGKRKPFTENEIRIVRDKLINSEASKQVIALNLISMNTGATCKELTHLDSSDIFLDAPVPYIAVRPNAHRNRVKGNGSRIREIPLIGLALDEMKKFPDGFDEFRKNNGSEELSRISNVLIKSAVKDRTFYSYRHTMADRLRQSGCNDTLKDALLGHTTKGFSMYYGVGYTLQNKLEALQKALPEDA